MEESMKKTRERLMDEFRQASSADKWTKECVEMMKNLLKSVYYIDVICAMEDGGEYPGEEYIGSGNSYARGGQPRNHMGRFISGTGYDNRGYDNRGSGMYPMYPYTNYRNGMSGTRYYDDEMGNIVHKLEHMMDTEINPEKRMAYQEVLNSIQMR